MSNELHTREEWLRAARMAVAEIVEDGLAQVYGEDHPVMDYFDKHKTRITAGFPKGRRGGKIQYHVYLPEQSKDGHYEHFISPEIDDAREALEQVLQAEIHNAGDFNMKCRAGLLESLRLACGLDYYSAESKWRVTLPTRERLNRIVATMPLYPAKGIKKQQKQSTRMVKLTCSEHPRDCKVLIRASATVAAVIETQPCPAEGCGGHLIKHV